MKTYERGGKSYIRVTEIVGKMFPFNAQSFEKWCHAKGINPDWVGQESRRIGTKIHSWLQNRFLGIDAWADSPPLSHEEEVYLKTADEIMKAFKVKNMEQTVYSDDWGYAGTYDMLLENGMLVDIKTWGLWRGKYTRSSEKIRKVRVQLSMYADPLLATQGACCVFLPDGGYVFEEVKLDDSWKRWIEENRDKLVLKKDENTR